MAPCRGVCTRVVDTCQGDVDHDQLPDCDEMSTVGDFEFSRYPDGNTTLSFTAELSLNVSCNDPVHGKSVKAFTACG